MQDLTAGSRKVGPHALWAAPRTGAVISAASVPRSAKREGRHEARIIGRLVPFFEAAGYDAVPHARFNIAWGSILSDVDLLLVGRADAPAGAEAGGGSGGRQAVAAVEVKSSRDDLRRAQSQVRRLLEYADYAYVATDYVPRRFDVRGAGLIVVRGGRVHVVRSAPPAGGGRRGRGWGAQAAAALPKKCLLRMAEARGAPAGAGRATKAELARRVTAGRAAAAVGGELARVATCGGRGACEAECPVWEFEGAAAAPLRIRPRGRSA